MQFPGKFKNIVVAVALVRAAAFWRPVFIASAGVRRRCAPVEMAVPGF
ncbi:MAG: hypothetical protein IPK63_19605 [Candidatus Competibacteraceae bacterium]|nr:hypothetical protein [Candidatus Competibacteraceae bacterium]